MHQNTATEQLDEIYHYMPAMQNTKSVGKWLIFWRQYMKCDVINITFIISWAVIPPITACIGEISPSAV